MRGRPGTGCLGPTYEQLRSTADICATTARVLSRQSGHNTAVIRAQLEVCIAACRSCADECARHADMHEHCRICAEVCKACENACRELLASMS